MGIPPTVSCAPLLITIWIRFFGLFAPSTAIEPIYDKNNNVIIANVGFADVAIYTPDDFLMALDRTVYAPEDTTTSALTNNRKIILMNDIDMTGYIVKNTMGTTFAGVFDGRGYVVSNLTVQAYGNNVNSRHGLFGKLSGTVRNVAFENMQGTGGPYYFSPFMAETPVYTAVIENVFVEIVGLS